MNPNQLTGQHKEIMLEARKREVTRRETLEKRARKQLDKCRQVLGRLTK